MVRQLCLLAISTHFLFAQETVHHTSVSGRIVDPSGGVVSGAKVTARNVDTNLTNRGESDHEGRFRLPYLKIGTYQITVTQPGFGDSVRSLALSAGGAYELAITLKVGIAETQVTVESESTLLEAARSQVTGTVVRKEWKLEWADIIRDLDNLIEMEVGFNGKSYVFRGQTSGVAGKVFQACSVALPPTMRPC